MFITFEGPDGAGKTTVLKHLVPLLQQQTSLPIRLSREPGGNKIAEEIRQIILDINNQQMDDRTEALLYAAARRQHLVENVFPQLRQGDIVISDRFVDSSIVYQGAGRQIGEAAVAQINYFATEGLTPDLTIYLDVPVMIGLQRIHQYRQTQNDRLDQEKISFHERVRQAYLRLWRANPQRIVKVDATQPLALVIDECQHIITQRFSQVFDGVK
ncbi:MAG: dTMP kinase [Candidatus Paralactobacillus gallistercoris]|uniref:Thymidylate kinase n=1 Tax=Candidatus Paralactobacillus gallistercoris TaxID=2838724 RepID=A0A948TJT1_9LACO|nr:dTMP kinase [Candidatus Paralactobacillus gallistercoris]